MAIKLRSRSRRFKRRFARRFLRKIRDIFFPLRAYRNELDSKLSLKFLHRWLTCYFRGLPDFLIVGAAKSGTTSLYNYLLQHESVLPALEKEVNFWYRRKKLSINWYRGNFPMKFKLKSKITGEASTIYLKFPNIAYKIKKDLPNAKILIILRNPVDRAFSGYNFALSDHHHESLSFADALVCEEFSDYRFFSYRQHGLYLKLLKPYYENFSKDQILVLDFDELKNHPQKLMNEVCDFLKINRKNDWHFEIYNQLSYSSVIDPKTRKWLVDYYLPHNKKLFEFLGRKFNWD